MGTKYWMKYLRNIIRTKNTRKNGLKLVNMKKNQHQKFKECYMRAMWVSKDKNMKWASNQKEEEERFWIKRGG